MPDEAFDSVAEADGAAVGSLSPTSDYVVPGPAIPEAVVFKRGAGGWSSEGPAATLRDPDDGLVFLSVAIAPDAEVIAGLLNSGEARVDVFVTPSGGWSGTLAPAAHLRSPNGRPLVGQVSFAGPAIVATTYGPSPAPYPGDTFVFPEPPGGWGSADSTPASLVHSKAALPRSGPHRGPWVMVTRPKGADVYGEPRTGWKGVVHQVGFLRPDKEFDGFPVYFSSRSAVIGEDVFSEPARGWTGTIRPTARLTINGINGSLGQAAIDREVVAVSSYRLGSEHNCPCTATIATAARSASSAHGNRLTATRTVSLTTALGPSLPVLDGRTLFVGGAQSIPVYALQPAVTVGAVAGG